MIDLSAIEAARERLAPYLPVTPVIRDARLCETSGAEVWLKLESLQHTGSFKVRGATHRMLRLPEDERARGVVAASAGNHAQGVAFGARHLGVSALIVMPEPTPLVKIERTRALGAEVVLAGSVFDEAQEHAIEIAGREGRTLVPPFDHPDVIAGQGTVGLEIAEQVPDADDVLVGIGGGGLISGIGSALATAPTRVLGVQSEAAPAMKLSFDSGERSSHLVGPTLAEGLSVRLPGELTFSIVSSTVEAIRTVSEREIEEAIYELLDGSKLVVEGAGAAACAPLLAPDRRFAGRKVVVVISGGNIDPGVLARVVERSLVRRRRLIRLRVRLSDRPGALAGLLDAVAREGANVRRVEHDRNFAGADFWSASVDLTLETRDPEHGERLLASLEEGGYAGVERLAES